MRGASRDALAAVRVRLDAILGEVDDEAIRGASEQLLSVARLLGSEHALTRALADPGTDVSARLALLDHLFATRLHEPALATCRHLAGARWSDRRDLVDAVEALGVQAGLVLAERQDCLDEVEDELFRFARIIERAPRLRAALGDPALPGESKRDLVNALLAGKVQPVTAALVESLVMALRGRAADLAIDALATAAAARRERQIAVVRVAVPLADDLRDRLAAALGRVLGRTVRVQVEIDPQLLGGVVVAVGGDLFDGSTVRRLAQAHRALTG